MPRVSTDTTDESPKRTPRKRAVRRVVSKSESVTSKPRTTRTPKARGEEVSESASVGTSSRRAPTQFTTSTTTKSSSKKYVIVLATLLLIIAGAAWIGISDDGQIDVTARINEQNQKKSIATEETNSATGETLTIPVQETPPAAISNIRPRTSAEEVAPAPQPEVASSTEETASSTEVVSEGEGANDSAATESPELAQ